MSDEATKAKRALRRLGQRTQQGLTRLRPLDHRHVTKVREAVRHQWEQKQHAQTEVAKPATRSQGHRQTKPQLKSKDQSKDHGHSH